MDIIQINKFSGLHNGKTIIFCKTDFLNDEFKYIEKLDNDVVLITGNSDYPITDYHVINAPKNIKKWFAQNALSNDERIIPLPIGIENKSPSIREGHGIGYFDRVLEKENLLLRNIKSNPTNFIYSNFNVFTNYNERSKCKNISLICNHIDWEENNLSLKEYFDKILEYKMILCPIGNGIDTHRLWEVLYSNRIPIIIISGDYKIYKLYEELPIIILKNYEELLDYELINKKYNECINSKYNTELLNTKYWINLIKEYES